MADPVTIITVSTTALIAGLSFGKDLVLPRWQSNEERTIESRTVLDEAGQRLNAAIRAADAVSTSIEVKARTPTANTFHQRQVLHDAREQLPESIARLAVRFGPTHKITEGYSRSGEALTDLAAELEDLEFGTPDPNRVERVREQRQRVGRESDVFFEAAARLIGPRRPKR